MAAGASSRGEWYVLTICRRFLRYSNAVELSHSLSSYYSFLVVDFVPERPSPLVGLRMPSEMSHPSTVMGQVAPDLEALRHSHAMMQMQQMNMTNAMQTSLQRQGAVNPSSLFSSGLATGGTGGLSDQGLADGKFSGSTHCLGLSPTLAKLKMHKPCFPIQVLWPGRNSFKASHLDKQP